MVETAEQSAGAGTDACRAALPHEGHLEVASHCGGHAHPQPPAATMTVRCTTKLRALLGKEAHQAADRDRSPSDWYANVVSIERRKCLLITHASTLFSVFVPDVRAGQLRPLGPFVVPRILAELHAEELDEHALGELDPDQVTIAKAVDRSVIGCMNDLALSCRLAAEYAGGLAALDLDELHHALQRHIYAARDYVPAIDLVNALPS